ncbi:tRNA (adenine(58)-N(1))-methyltransferase, mitochondrial [Hoplias malabaricus]|uniref:tRNA (adenine(58)-N(1))-methyltransferase, mitochondrial n=1 Tax=Hoplias malabaricus TaxID=27720 RepID=UPI003461CF2A
MTQRLARIWASYLRRKTFNTKFVDNRVAPIVLTFGLKGFGTGSKSSDGDPEVPEALGPTLSRFSRGASRFERRRPLSPLERVSQLLPQDSLSKEVWELRGNKSLEEPEPETAEWTQTTGEDQLTTQTSRNADGEVEAQEQYGVLDKEMETAEQSRRTEGMERTMCYGETLMAEYRRNRRLEFRKMFQLQEGQKLQSNWGVVLHQAIAGHLAGIVLRTSLGLPMLFRRPSLEEFTLFMKRGPAIAYPKDTSAMMMMMDVSEGDCVLESGSGSGAMSLFLSRAVGSKGSVLSVEVRADHHKRSVLNYQRWRSNWKLSRGKEWPDNVHFHHGDLISSAPFLAGQSFNSVALDMISPHLALPAVVPHLNHGAICAVYLANITQIIDLMEGLRCSSLPLVCERIIEVQYRDWLLAPSVKKDGTFNQRKPMSKESEDSENDDSSDAEGEGLNRPKEPSFGSVPYIARPHPEQLAHTAFLVKLRKIQK